MGRDTPLVYQWDNIWKLFLQKHLHSTEAHKTHVFIALCIISLQDIFACFLFFQTSLVAERAGRLQCQLRKFSFCSCTPSFSFLVFLLLGPAIHPCRHFLLLTHWLMFKEDKQHAPLPPPPSLQTQHPHKHTHWTHSSKLSCLNGVDFSPRCRDNRTSEGESPNRQKSPWGADLVAHFTLFVLSP